MILERPRLKPGLRSICRIRCARSTKDSSGGRTAGDGAARRFGQAVPARPRVAFKFGAKELMKNKVHANNFIILLT